MSRPLAVVYAGPASLPGCPEAAAGALASSSFAFEIEFAGRRDLARLLAARPALYCQPGGGELRPAWRRLRRDAEAIRAYVRSGGRYLGFCLGGYLAGDDPGFGLLAGPVDSYLAAPGAEVAGPQSTIVEVDWAGTPRRLYFQDGCFFTPGPGTEVVARYRTGLAAAVVAAFGAGRVAVCGPHPEATDDWFRDEDLPPLARPTLDLAHDLNDRVMEP